MENMLCLWWTITQKADHTWATQKIPSHHQHIISAAHNQVEIK